MIMNTSYVYLYLDPRDRMIVETPDLSLLYRPFYVGKGTGDRSDYRCRLHNIKGKFLNQELKNELQSILSDGLEPITLKVECDDELDAYAMEKRLTQYLGIHPTGLLTNKVLGGKGAFKFTDETKELISRLNRGENNPNYGTTWSADRRKKMEDAWNRKRADGSNKRTPEQMKAAWDSNKRSYEITSPNGEVMITDHLVNFCHENGFSLTTLRKALKGDGIVKSLKRKSRMDGYKIRYLIKS